MMKEQKCGLDHLHYPSKHRAKLYNDDDVEQQNNCISTCQSLGSCESLSSSVDSSISDFTDLDRLDAELLRKLSTQLEGINRIEQSTNTKFKAFPDSMKVPSINIGASDAFNSGTLVTKKTTDSVSCNESYFRQIDKRRGIDGRLNNTSPFSTPFASAKSSLADSIPPSDIDSHVKRVRKLINTMKSRMSVDDVDFDFDTSLEGDIFNVPIQCTTKAVSPITFQPKK